MIQWPIPATNVNALHANAQLVDDKLAENERGGGQYQRKTQYGIDQTACRSGRQIKLPENKQRQEARRYAASGKPDNRGPMNSGRPTMDGDATALGGRRIQQISADGRGRMDAEQ